MVRFTFSRMPRSPSDEVAMNPNLPKARRCGLVVCAIVPPKGLHGIVRHKCEMTGCDQENFTHSMHPSTSKSFASSQEDFVQHCLLLKTWQFYLDTYCTTRSYLDTLLRPTPVGACGSLRHGRVYLSRAEPLRLRELHRAVSAEVSPGEPWTPTGSWCQCSTGMVLSEMALTQLGGIVRNSHGHHIYIYIYGIIWNTSKDFPDKESSPDRLLIL